MLTAALVLSVFLMIALPLGLAWALTRRFGLGWGLVGAGALTFILSQVVHLPILFGLTALLNWLPFKLPPAAVVPVNAVVLGLLAGLCEEIARYGVYRRFLPAARTWGHGLVFGAGHGGVEAVILGVLAALTVAQMMILRSSDPSQLGVPAGQLVAVQKQVADFWAAPWYAGLLGALERVFTLCIHLSCSLLVLQAFTRKHSAWLWAAVLWHALVDSAAVWAVGQNWGPYWTEAVVAVFAAASVILIFLLRDRPAPAPAAALAAGEVLP